MEMAHSPIERTSKLVIFRGKPLWLRLHVRLREAKTLHAHGFTREGRPKDVHMG